MSEIDIDFNNPFLYVGGFAALSLLTNIYCVCKHASCFKTKKEGEVELTSNDFNSKSSYVDENFVNSKIDEETPATTTKEIGTTMRLDTVVEARDLEDEGKETGTQTEDSVLYDMMGERFSQELDFYKNMNINKKKAERRLSV